MKTYSVRNVRALGSCLSRQEILARAGCSPSDRFTALEIARMEAFSAEDRLWFFLCSDALPTRDLRYLLISFAERALEYADNPRMREFIRMAIHQPERARDKANEYLDWLNKEVDPDHFMWLGIADSFVVYRCEVYTTAQDLLELAAECANSAYVEVRKQLSKQFLELAVLTFRRVELVRSQHEDL